MNKIIVALGSLILSLFLTSCEVDTKLAPLTVSDDSRYLMAGDRPFLWLGDTAWELFHVLDREETITYLDNRAEKGFTIIQAVALAELNGTTTPNAYGDIAIFDNDLKRINEAYFDHVEWVLKEVESRGLYVAFLPTWGDKVANVYKNDRPIFTPETAYEFGKYLSDRFGEYPLVWVLGGDRNVISQEVRDIWDAMAEGILAGKGGNLLMTYHPQGDTSSSEWFHNTDWLSFNSYQSGHARRYDPVYKYCRRHENLTPRKPYVNMEPCYEDIPMRFWLYRDPVAQGLKYEDYIAEDGRVINPSLYAEGVFNAYDVRVAAYWTLLSGAAGYTYGHNSMWQMFKPYGQTTVPALEYWYNALDTKGSESMRYVSELFNEYPLGSFVPNNELLVGENKENGSYIALSSGCNKEFVLAYMPQGGNVKINCQDLNLSGNAQWYNPLNGNRVDENMNLEDGVVSFNAPDSNDWVLILE